MESRARDEALLAAALWLCLLAPGAQGCGFPSPEACELACGEQDACPGGFECQASSHLCVPIGRREACLTTSMFPNQSMAGAGSGAAGAEGARDAAAPEVNPPDEPASGGAGGAVGASGDGFDAGSSGASGSGAATDALSIVELSPGSACSGVELSRTLRASGGSGAYSWSLVESPDGLQLSAASGSEVVLAGLPRDPGSVVVELADASGASVRSAELVVYERPRLLTERLPALCAGQAYDAVLFASGGDAGQYEWSAELLPAAGLAGTLSELGLALRGSTLSADAGAAIAELGGARIAVAVRDARCSSVPLELELEVIPAEGGECPEILLAQPADALPEACLDNFYAEALAAEGGEPPYLWSVLSVPPGLRFDPESALLSGVPEGDGVLELELSDDGGRTARRSYPLHARERCWLAYVASEPAPSRLELVDPRLLERQPENARRRLPEAGTDAVLDFQFSPDGRFIAYRLASAAGPARLELARVSDGRASPIDLPGAVGAYAWSPDAATLAVVFTSAQQPRLGGVDVSAGAGLLESRALAGSPAQLSWYDAEHVALLAPDPEVPATYWLATARRAGSGYEPPVAHVELAFSERARLLGGAGGVFVSDPVAALQAFFPSDGSAPGAHAPETVPAPSGAFVGIARAGALHVFRPFEPSALLDPSSPPVPVASAAGCTSLLGWARERELVACAASFAGEARLALFELGAAGALRSSQLALPGATDAGRPRAFSRSGRWFALAGAENLELVSSDGASPRLWATLPSVVLGSAADSLSFSPDESWLLIGAGNALRLLDLAAGPESLRELGVAALGGEGCSERFVDGPWCGSEPSSTAPFWSSDSQWLGFRSVLGTLQLLDVSRGAQGARPLSPDAACSEACRSGSSAVFQP